MKPMNKHEQEIYFALEKLGLKVFSVSDLLTQGFKKRVIHDALVSLAKKGVVARVRRGVYVRAEPKFLFDSKQQTESALLVAAKTAQEKYYIGYASAMQLHGVTEQVPFTVYAASTKQRRDFKYGNHKIKFVKVGRRKFFGYTQMKLSGQEIMVSNMEKSIVDCVDHPEYCGGIENAKQMIGELAAKDLDWERVKAYALRMRNQALIHRLGYVLEQISLQKRGKIPEKVIKALHGKVKPQVYYLERGAAGNFVKRWYVIAKEGREDVV